MGLIFKRELQWLNAFLVENNIKIKFPTQELLGEMTIFVFDSQIEEPISYKIITTKY